MRYLHYIILAALTATLFTSCEKEIEIGYRSIDKLYVVEALFSADSSKILVSQTRDMNDSTKTAWINSASVEIERADSSSIECAFSDDGSYRASHPIALTDYELYRLKVDVGGEVFEATSQLFPKPVIGEVNYNKLLMPEMGIDMVFCSFSIKDTKGVDNYYRYRYSVNGEKQDWLLMKDVAQDGADIWVTSPLITEDLLLKEGDKIEIELHSIDVNIYEYYNSLSLSSSTAANPISNMKGGCLGYFSAYSSTLYKADYSESLLGDNM